MEMEMDDILQYFKQSLDDRKLSTGERKTLQKTLDEIRPDRQQSDLLRSKIWDMAIEQLVDSRDADIVRWLEKASRLLIPEQQDLVESRVYFSPGDDCLNAIIGTMDRALYSLDICVFTISDDRIAEQILHCHKRGIKVRIISDDDKTQDLGSDIFRLADAGIPVKIDRTESHMHNKFAVVDRELALTGSFNWTRSASEYNNENVLVTSDPRVVKGLDDEFDRLWEIMKKY
jgi:cardiolipin hydrolase